MQVFDGFGKALNLGPSIAGGGEGDVYHHPTSKDSLIKIYKTPTRERSEKVLALIGFASLADAALLKHAAWPTEAIYSANDRRLPIGFTMPRMNGVAIHSIYSPMERKQTLPDFSWRQLVQVARNSAIALDGLHKAGIVFGDINEGNFIVTGEGFVKVIDCDSYQLKSSGRLFLCPGGVGMWTPPELQGESFENAVRTPDHDVFGLAVLIFQLLFIGRHPFAVRRQDDHTMEQAIQRNLFAYSPELASKGVAVPELSLPVSSVGQTLYRLFEQAFLAYSDIGNALLTCATCGTTNRVRRSATQSTVLNCGKCKNSLPACAHHKRPTAADWVAALKEFDSTLTVCQANKTHYFARGQQCPFCYLETIGFFAFVPALTGNYNPTSELGADNAVRALWEKIRTAPVPTFALTSGPITAVTGKPLPAGVGQINPTFIFAWIVLGASLFGFAVIGPAAFIGLVVGGMMLSAGAKTPAFQNEVSSRESAVSAAKSAHAKLLDELKSEEAKIAARLKAIRMQAQQIFGQIEELKPEYTRGLQDLETRRKDIQLRAYLERFLIRKRKFHGLGPKRLVVLQVNSIETAADVYFAKYRVSGVPGDVWNTIRKWSNDQASKFTFDVSKPPPVEEKARLASSLTAKKHALAASLHKCGSDWAEAAQTAKHIVDTIIARSHEAKQNIIQSEADLAVVRG